MQCSLVFVRRPGLSPSFSSLVFVQTFIHFDGSIGRSPKAIHFRAPQVFKDPSLSFDCRVSSNCKATAAGPALHSAGVMAMTMQSPLQLDSLSNGFMGMALNTPRPASQVSLKPGTNIRMAIKRWERKEVKENSLPVVKKLHVKIGDTVKVIAGHDKGKVSTVTQLYTHNSKILLKDINLKTKHVKGKAEGETGQIVQVEAPVHSSNVMLYSKTAKVASRVGHKTLEDGSRVRYLLKTGEVIDSAEEWKKVHKKKDDKKE